MSDREHPLLIRRVSTKAIRLTFSYEGEKIALVGQQHVEMIVPPSDPVHAEGSVLGFWLDSKDAQGHILFRRALHDPIRSDAEIFSQGRERTIVRTPIDDPKGMFVVLLPDVEHLDHVALTKTVKKQGDDCFCGKEVGRFTLTK